MSPMKRRNSVSTGWLSMGMSAVRRHQYQMIIRIAIFAAAASGCRAPSAVPVVAGSYLFVLAGADDVHSGGSDFLAVIDADSLSPKYATIVATVPIHAVGTMPHHMELTMPGRGRANAAPHLAPLPHAPRSPL